MTTDPYHLVHYKPRVSFTPAAFTSFAAKNVVEDLGGGLRILGVPVDENAHVHGDRKRRADLTRPLLRLFDRTYRRGVLEGASIVNQNPQMGGYDGTVIDAWNARPNNAMHWIWGLETAIVTNRHPDDPGAIMFWDPYGGWARAVKGDIDAVRRSIAWAMAASRRAGLLLAASFTYAPSCASVDQCAEIVSAVHAEPKNEAIEALEAYLATREPLAWESAGDPEARDGAE